MKPVLATVLLAALGSAPLLADGFKSPWSRVPSQPDKSQGATVAQVLGTSTWVQIAYHRPGVRGRDVWAATNSRGQSIVPRGGEPYPWRAGANEATTIELTTDVTVEGEELAAGKYALFMIPGSETWTVVFNRDHEQWGSRGHDASQDALRVEVTPEEAPFNEWLQYGFDACEAWSTRAYLHWAKLKVPFEVAVPSEQG